MVHAKERKETAIVVAASIASSLSFRPFVAKIMCFRIRLKVVGGIREEDLSFCSHVQLKLRIGNAVMPGVFISECISTE